MASNVTLQDLLQELAEQRNIDFRGYKKTTLERRFRRRMFQVNMPGYAEYGSYIGKHPEEVNRLLNTILINVTEFFRDPPAWEIGMSCCLRCLRRSSRGTLSASGALDAPAAKSPIR